MLEQLGTLNTMRKETVTCKTTGQFLINVKPNRSLLLENYSHSPPFHSAHSEGQEQLSKCMGATETSICVDARP